MERTFFSRRDVNLQIIVKNIFEKEKASLKKCFFLSPLGMFAFSSSRLDPFRFIKNSVSESQFPMNYGRERELQSFRESLVIVYLSYMPYYSIYIYLIGRERQRGARQIDRDRCSKEERRNPSFHPLPSGRKHRNYWKTSRIMELHEVYIDPKQQTTDQRLKQIYTQQQEQNRKKGKVQLCFIGIFSFIEYCFCVFFFFSLIAGADDPVLDNIII